MLSVLGKCHQFASIRITSALQLPPGRLLSWMATPVPPPAAVRGMRAWQPQLFDTTASLPCLLIQPEKMAAVKKVLEPYVAKIKHFQTVQDGGEGKRLVVLNSKIVSSQEDIQEQDWSQLKSSGVTEADFLFRQFSLNSRNWSSLEKLKAVLPEDQEGVSGFSIIGHVVHLNLKDHLLPFKNVIGEILLESTKNVRTVVNKTSGIDNTFRNFSLELLAGTPDYQVTTKENGCNFTFDFSQVYWNPRLSTEHERILKQLPHTSILFDACAGVGPFSIPAAKKVSKVYANDLNPESYKWLQHNAAKNKIKDGKLQCFNMDAREFIVSVLKPELGRLWAEGEEREVQVTLNLPALAVTFLDVFQGLMSEHAEMAGQLPLVHVYCFSKAAEDPAEDVQTRCEEYLGSALDTDHLMEIKFVRNVAPKKEMMRVSFRVPLHVLCGPKKTGSVRRRSSSGEQGDSLTKKLCAEVT